jgi:hypothetical protein
VPVAALLLTVNVNVDEPDPGEAILVGLKAAVTPEGMPLAESETALSNPPETLDVIVEVPLLPWFTVSELGPAVRVKPAVLLVIVSEIVVVCVTPPPVPVTVIV